MPSLFLHYLTELVKFIREFILRITGIEFKTFLLCQGNDFRSKRSRKLSHSAKNHVPRILIDCCPSRLSLEDVHQIHERSILHILAERSHERWITQTWPYILDLLEQHYHKLIESKLCLALCSKRRVDCTMEALQVSHHRSHHSAR